MEGRQQGGSQKARRRAAIEFELKLARAVRLVTEAMQHVLEEGGPDGPIAATVNLAQAARALEMPAANLRHAISKGDLDAKKEGDEWVIAFAPLLDYGTRRYTRILGRRIMAAATGLIDESGRPTATRRRATPSPATPPAQPGAIRP